MISILSEQVVIIRQRIDQLELKCQGIDNILVEVTEKKDIVYTFSATQFQSYFNGVYGINAYSNFVSTNSPLNPNLALYSYSIFSDQWGNAFGSPYGNDFRSGSSAIITDYSFGDFQCSNYQNQVNMDSKINKIHGNTIYAIDNAGKTYELQLGACSRINGINQNIPNN
jgi:hypothetical protein